MKMFPKIFFLCVTILFLTTSTSQAVRIKDLASVKGVRNNQLIGYGLVVGLNGTGDGSKAAFTTQGLVNMLKNMGIPVTEKDINVKNVAGVMITATLPPFVKSGQTIDVTLSSLGDASSLQGGTLVATPLKGLDGEIYAMAQGPVSIGGFATSGPVQPGSQENHLTVARIPDGATVERSVNVSFQDKEKFIFSLNNPDFTTVMRMVNVMNGFLGEPKAKAIDGATVEVRVPENFADQQISLLASLENLEIKPDSIAKVVVDERTGTIVMGENVRIDSLALSHGTLSVQVSSQPTEEIISNDLIGQTLTNEMVREMTNNIRTQQGATATNRLVDIEPGVTLGELVRALNSVGAAPRDLIAIFQSIKAAGALQAELEII